MEYFDEVVFDEVRFTKPEYHNLLNQYVSDIPITPNAPNYQSGRKLMAEECLAANQEMECAFQFSESVSAWTRSMAVYRDEQFKTANNKLLKLTSYIKPIKDIIDKNPISQDDMQFLKSITPNDVDDITTILDTLEVQEDIPFYKIYLRFTKENNVDNFKKILEELPKEWTIVQLTAPYNANENLKQLSEYRMEINSIYLSVFTNDYLEDSNIGPFTVNIPANVTKEGVKPLFTELYSLLEDNYKTIDNAKFLNNKRSIQNYWHRREDVDLRMKSVINVMDREWLGGWGCLLTGKLVDRDLRARVQEKVDNAIQDWGFIKLTGKQKILLYNLMESSPMLSPTQIKSCIRHILTEHGNPDDIKRVLTTDACQNCTKEFQLLNELCLKCLSKCFEALHCFTLVDGIKAFSGVANEFKDGDEWAELRKAKRLPVILIVDEVLDTFPWESLPILNQHPVSRIENIHFLYYLYKLHEHRIVDGYFRANAEVGRYVINPEKNLERMEKRMSAFVSYWCDKWTGHIGEPPPAEEFIKNLTEADLFLYCGHGDGCHFANGGANGAGVEGAVGTQAVVILSGCGSVRLIQPPGRSPPHASHHRLHIAGSPLVIGMLWEVTDLEVDKMVSTLISIYCPCDKPAWPSVGKAKWSQGVLEPPSEQKVQSAYEADLLRAICKSRRSTNYVMIASSMVARGIPVFEGKGNSGTLFNSKSIITLDNIID